MRKNQNRWLPLVIGAILCISCEREPAKPGSPALHPAELSLARKHLQTGRPDLALAILSHSPDHPETAPLLENTRWHAAATQFDHPGFEIHHITLRPDSLWVALTKSPLHTLIRWDLNTLEIQAVLFPSPDPLRAAVFSPTGSHAIIVRGEVSLLVDAQTLKPIADIGTIPPGITPVSTIVFSQNSLLLAHPEENGWQIRDTTTGEPIRTISASELPASTILAAHLDSTRLRLLADNGTFINAPVSPVDAISTHPFDGEPPVILYAHLIRQGETAIISRHLGPHLPPELIEFDLGGTSTPSPFDLDAWIPFQSHSALPNLHTGLLRHLTPPAVEFSGAAVLFHGNPRPPILPDGDSTIVAYAADPESGTFATAGSDGLITLHQPAKPPEHPTPQSLTELAGHHFDRATASFHRTATTANITSSLDPLEQRLAAAAATPENAPASRLAHAINHHQIDTLVHLLESAPNLPHALRTLATSVVHLHHGNTAAAFAPYHHGFPNIASIRLREDWHGWEAVDFQPAVDSLERHYNTILTTLTIDPAADESARHQTITRLTDPASLQTLGQTRYATACLDAAKALTLIAGEAGHAFTLATIARRHGAPSVDCLRTEALALTALEHFPDAHSRWIDIVTNHPVSHHQPGDYAEAAYTAYETNHPSQAIEILITGIHRFGDDPSFALRCGWIALLANRPDHARAFLLRGQRAGYSDEEIEHATALLAISASLTHDTAAAAAHFQDLLAIDPSWADAETLDALPWPEHLVAPIRGLTW